MAYSSYPSDPWYRGYPGRTPRNPQILGICFLALAFLVIVGVIPLFVVIACVKKRRQLRRQKELEKAVGGAPAAGLEAPMETVVIIEDVRQ